MLISVRCTGCVCVYVRYEESHISCYTDGSSLCPFLSLVKVISIEQIFVLDLPSNMQNMLPLPHGKEVSYKEKPSASLIWNMIKRRPFSIIQS